MNATALSITCRERRGKEMDKKDPESEIEDKKNK
jgi:hypothetical protein